MISITEVNKRLAFINSQPLDEREKLKARINDIHFWDIIKRLIKPEENGRLH